MHPKTLMVLLKQLLRIYIGGEDTGVTNFSSDSRLNRPEKCNPQFSSTGTTVIITGAIKISDMLSGGRLKEFWKM